jgi:hypothetical protein
VGTAGGEESPGLTNLKISANPSYWYASVGNCAEFTIEVAAEFPWQKHTVRRFISILASKGGMKIASSRRESDGARVYEA